LPLDFGSEPKGAYQTPLGLQAREVSKNTTNACGVPCPGAIITAPEKGSNPLNRAVKKEDRPVCSPGRIQIRRAADAAELTSARQLAARFAHAAGASATDVKLAVNEAIANVVDHAYRHGPPGAFELEIYCENGRLCAIVRDEGSGPIPNPDSDGAGLGLKLIEGLTESHTIHARPDRGTEVRMLFPLNGRPAGPA
jgi:anti-sigma regulatory factor (Ser/Thr protein kinase)